MEKKIKIFGVIVLKLLILPNSGKAIEYIQEVEKDYSLRSIGRLQVTQPQGRLILKGWAIDKIRIKYKKKVDAENQKQADEMFKLLSYRYQTVGKDIEISSLSGIGLGIEKRLREKEQLNSSSEMVIFAPASLKLQVWSVSGAISIKNWNSPIEIRAGKGLVKVETVKADHLNLDCSECSVQVKNFKGGLRLSGESGDFEIDQVSGKSIFIETQSGTIRTSEVESSQIYLTKTGLIEGQGLKGPIEFSTQKGDVKLRDVSGFLSGKTESGNIYANIRNWEFQDKAVIESISGHIELILPKRFSGEVDFSSLQGKISSNFHIEKPSRTPISSPDPVNRLSGRIGEGGELLKISTETGSVTVHQGPS